MKKFEIKLYQKPDTIVTYWIHQPFTVIMIVVFGLAFNILMPWGAVNLGKVIDTILISSSTGPIFKAVIIYVEIIVFIQVLRYIKRFYIRRFANRTLASMRTHAFNSVLSSPYASFINAEPGNLMSRIVGDVDACVEGMRKFTTELFDTGVLMAAYIMTMLQMDVTVTLTSILFIPLAMFIAEKLKTTIVKASSAYRKQSAAVTSLTFEASENALLYRISSVDPIIQKNYETALDDLRKKAIKANVLENSMQPLYNAIAMTGVAFVFTLGAAKVIGGHWTIGTFTAFLTIFTAMSLKSSKAAKLFNSVQKSSVSWKRIKPFMIPYHEMALSEASTQSDLTMTLNDLSFSYQDNPIIEQLSLSVKSGQWIGITGPVASGKSTLLSVLTGLLDYSGSITVNGQELKLMDHEERSALIAYLPQRPQLFGESLKDNITWESEGDIDLVLDQVQLKAEVSAMENQSETGAGNLGNRLSGGQKARLALARTLFSNRKILLLDDPFASVDMATQLKILDALKASYQDSIILLVSHRVTMFNAFDKVLYMEDKGKALFGTHQELMDKSETYHDLVALQEGETDDEK
jgi:ATP-binding cassette subfamily B multidrug efflux pump